MKAHTVPRHLGVILDGNRRWAAANGKKTLDGHRRGSEVFKELSLGLFERGVEYVSAYVFSKENWKRTATEVDYLMRLVVKAVELHLDEYHRRGIRVRVIGERDGLKPAVIKAIDRTEERTKNNTKGTLVLCFNYGGRQEIVDSVKSLLADGVQSADVTEDMITSNLYAADVPDVDLMIRTSGEERISGFMLWRLAYAELAFVDKYWPDMTLTDMDQLLENFTNRNRRFGAS